MNLGRSINIAMAKRDMNRTALAKALGTSNQAVHAIITRGSTQSETIRRLAEAFGMPVSEFIKLGEE
jgi:plasmid maintenance system antidote protein VapI